MGANKTGRSGADVVLPVPPGTIVRDASGEFLGECWRTATRSSSRGAGAAGRATRSSPRPRTSRRASGSRAKKARCARSSSSSSSSPTSVWSASRTRGSRRCSRSSPPRAQNRRLPVHDALAEPRRRPADRRRTFVVADIPGIIEGATRERARTPVPAPHRAHARPRVPHPDRRDGLAAGYDQLRHEVAAYSAELADKPHCVVFTKMDLFGEDFVPPIEAPDAFGSFAISAAARTGLDPLLAGWWRELLGSARRSNVVREACSSPEGRIRCARSRAGPGRGPAPVSRTSRTLRDGTRRVRRYRAARAPRAVEGRSPANRAWRGGMRRAASAARRARVSSAAARAVGSAAVPLRVGRPLPVGSTDGGHRRNATIDVVRRASHGCNCRCARDGRRLCGERDGPRNRRRRTPRRAAVSRRYGRRVRHGRRQGVSHSAIGHSIRTIAERGVVLSEFPCGAPAAPASFPRRNRIIAALARLTIVIEAGEKSGALITVDARL